MVEEEEGGRGIGERGGERRRRKIGHIIHKSDLMTIFFRCSMSIYALSSINMCT